MGERKRKRIPRVDLGEGLTKVGNGPGYLIFGPPWTFNDGNTGQSVTRRLVSIMRQSRLGKKGKGPNPFGDRLGAIKNMTRAVEFAGIVITVNDLAYANPDEPAYAQPLAKLLQAIITQADPETTERMMRHLGSMVQAAQRLIKRERLSEFAPAHRRFLVTLPKVAESLQRVPTKGEVGKAMFAGRPYTPADARRVTELCEANGFGWLPTGAPGRPRRSA